MLDNSRHFEPSNNVRRHRKRGVIKPNTGKLLNNSNMQPTRKKKLQGRLQHLAVLELRQDGYDFKFIDTFLLIRRCMFSSVVSCS